MEKRRHRRHSTELKLRLVQAYLNGEGSFKSISKAHDISHALLMQWVDKFRRELVELQVDDDQAAQLPVEDEEVHPVPFVSNPQAALVSDKGEVAPQLQQEAQKEHNGTREA